jgi:diphthine synthase
MVELESDEMVRNADKVDVAFLVVGDPLGLVDELWSSRCKPLTSRATTHTDLLLRCSQLNIPTTTIHNASILTALGSTGLQMYNFGQTLSLVFYTETWTPQSWYDRLEENLRIGMHTLVLVDIKVREQSEENMARCVLFYRLAS